MDERIGMDAEQVVEAVRSEQERTVDTAYALERAIVDGIRDIRRMWVRLAEYLYFFRRDNVWATLGYESLNHWLASPDVEMSRSTFYNLSTAYEQFVVARGVAADRLGSIDLTKAVEVLPAVRRGHVSVDSALADCEVLTRRDLHDKYTGRDPRAAPGSIEEEPVRPDSFHWESCKTCGTRRKVWD